MKSESMLDLPMKSLSNASRRRAAAKYLGERVCCVLQNGKAHRGKLLAATTLVLQLDKVDVDVNQLERIRVYVGGDWLAKNPSGADVRLARIHVRLHAREKVFLERAAKKLGCTLTQILLDGGLDRASEALGEPKPS